MSTSSKLPCESCKCSTPEIEKIEQMLGKRNLRQLTTESDCKDLRSFQFKQPDDCEFVNMIGMVAAEVLRNFPDVVRLRPSRTVFLESLHEIPDGPFGDLTGDHDKQIQIFLSVCLKQKLIPQIGSVIDIGGQNNATIKQVAKVFDNDSLPSLIVDSNIVTPALSEEQPNVKYVIEGAFLFFFIGHIRSRYKGTSQ